MQYLGVLLCFRFAAISLGDLISISFAVRLLHSDLRVISSIKQFFRSELINIVFVALFFQFAWVFLLFSFLLKVICKLPNNININ